MEYTMMDIVRMVNEVMDSDLEPEEMKVQLDAISGAFADKADGIKRAIDLMEGDVNTIKEEEARLYARRKAIENRQEKLKNYIKFCFEATGTEKLKTALYSYSLRLTPGSVVIDDESKIPSEYLKPQPPLVDKKGIKEFLSTGEVSDFAHLEQTTMLTIR